ncbi:MAG TPA: cutinase family protein, partial [Mycobacterium sp.]|nr:cutinase family protein [Mycobacterium sp.]
MSARRLLRIVGAAAVMMWGFAGAPISPTASADPCSDVEVVFARGTHQEPGLGNIGQAFSDSLTSKVGG